MQASEAKSPENSILMSKGPFCTPRSVIKNMTTKARPKLDEVAELMKKLANDGIGTFKNISQKERVFFKLLPEEENKDSVCGTIGDRWADYVSNFKTIDTKYITLTQFNRLLGASPYSADQMAEYSIHPRVPEI